MDYCGPRGIPLSKFLAWDYYDQVAALSWSAHERRRCSGCGTHPEDWPPDRDKHLWQATYRECQGCVELQRLADAPEVKAIQRGAHLYLRRR